MSSPTPLRSDSRWLIAALLLVVVGAVVMVFITRPARTPEVKPAVALPSIGGEILTGPEARFTWGRDARADIYRLEVYDLHSHLLAAAMLRDTSILASAVLPDTAQVGVWRVVPVSKGGTELPPTHNTGFLRK